MATWRPPARRAYGGLVGEDVERQRLLLPVDEGDAVLQRLHGDDGQDGAEDLLRHQSVRHQAGPVPGRHDAGQVGAALGVRAVELLQRLAQRGQQGVPRGGRAQHVVRRHAALARVEVLGPRQAAGGGRDVHPAVDEARTLAAQLQGHRGQVDRGGLQDDARHRLRT
ncbi:hypothetical protein EYF80_024790 [Liparis tanakae]|uniref:Uncharacterized protein n=1 Tax=Liparis tanakae TaxID=230148 RepID=A0A4Z2HHG6_9TELE|nr:hypothetical protein EYF80_024790 [Liparis tanakae]